MSEQILDLTSITHYFGDRLIVDNVSLVINRTDRIGLVGENGTGKTTLARIILGLLEPEYGQVQLAADTEIGYLPQDPQLDEAITIQQFMEREVDQLDELRATLHNLESQIGTPGLAPEYLKTLLDTYGSVQEEFTRRGGYDSDYRLDNVLNGLGLAHIDRTRPMRTLSGGEKTRVMLAGLLLRAPTLLILDEPTNHLDFAAVDWLENYLLAYTGAIIAIAHDRHFLNKVASQIVELSSVTHTLAIYHGNYDFYLAERERIQARQQDAYEAQQAERKILQQMIKAKTFAHRAAKPMRDSNKMAYDKHGESVARKRSSEINHARRRLEEIEANKLTHPVNGWQINPNFVPEALGSREVIRLVNISKRFGDQVLFAGLSATIRLGERVVLCGPNGTGKTTLLKMILGLEQPDTGVIMITPGARIGYLDQEQETLDPTQTVLEAYCRDLSGTENEHRANLHRYGLFSYDQVHQTIGSLSVGQQRKLQIARLIGTKANVLVLDEPTNHLDLASVEQFERALCEYQGTILATSHDRYFVERVATVTWTLHEPSRIGQSGLIAS